MFASIARPGIGSGLCPVGGPDTPVLDATEAIMSKATKTPTKATARARTSSPKPRSSAHIQSKRASKSPGKASPAAAMTTKSKCDQVIELLRRNKGASIAELQEATGWKAHSVRGLLSGTVKKRMGLSVTSVKPDGERRYLIGKA